MLFQLLSKSASNKISHIPKLTSSSLGKTAKETVGNRGYPHADHELKANTAIRSVWFRTFPDKRLRTDLNSWNCHVLDVNKQNKKKRKRKFTCLGREMIGQSITRADPHL
jgi:hypothetical protein